MPRLSVLLAALAVLCAARVFAAGDVEFVQTLQPVMRAAADGRYKIAEKKANQALDLLKDLRRYADETADRADGLRKEMLGRHYDDMVNTRLMPDLFQAKSARETIGKTYDLERGNVKDALKAAKAGDFGPVEAATARVNAFEAERESAVKAVDARVAAVRAAYERHYGNALAALARFDGLPLVKELVAANPKLVKKTELVPASVRPLVWRVELIKEKKEYNDPRFGRLPKSIAIADGSETRVYAVIVR